MKKKLIIIIDQPLWVKKTKGKTKKNIFLSEELSGREYKLLIIIMFTFRIYKMFLSDSFTNYSGSHIEIIIHVILLIVMMTPGVGSSKD